MWIEKKKTHENIYKNKEIRKYFAWPKEFPFVSLEPMIKVYITCIRFNDLSNKNFRCCYFRFFFFFFLLSCSVWFETVITNCVRIQFFFLLLIIILYFVLFILIWFEILSDLLPDEFLFIYYYYYWKTFSFLQFFIFIFFFIILNRPFSLFLLLS